MLKPRFSVILAIVAFIFQSANARWLGSLLSFFLEEIMPGVIGIAASEVLSSWDIAPAYLLLKQTGEDIPCRDGARKFATDMTFETCKKDVAIDSGYPMFSWKQDGFLPHLGTCYTYDSVDLNRRCPSNDDEMHFVVIDYVPFGYNRKGSGYCSKAFLRRTDGAFLNNIELADCESLCSNEPDCYFFSYLSLEDSSYGVCSRYGKGDDCNTRNGSNDSDRHYVSYGKKNYVGSGYCSNGFYMREDGVPGDKISIADCELRCSQDCHCDFFSYQSGGDGVCSRYHGSNCNSRVQYPNYLTYRALPEARPCRAGYCSNGFYKRQDGQDGVPITFQTCKNRCKFDSQCRYIGYSAAGNGICSRYKNIDGCAARNNPSGYSYIAVGVDGATVAGRSENSVTTDQISLSLPVYVGSGIAGAFAVAAAAAVIAGKRYKKAAQIRNETENDPFGAFKVSSGEDSITPSATVDAEVGADRTQNE